MNNKPQQNMLRRELSVFGTTMMGLGSIIGTGVFVSIGAAAGPLALFRQIRDELKKKY